MTDNNTPQSANEALLADILGGSYDTGIPQSRMEKIWAYALKEEGVSPEAPQSRLEALAIQVAESVRTGGGGGGTSQEDAIIERSISGDYTNSTATKIGSRAFQGCYDLENATFSAATEIDGYAFYQCSKLESISCPLVTSIGKYAFYDSNVLETISFPAATTIDTYAFSNCRSLASVYLPEVTTVGDFAFTINNSTFTSVIEHISLPKATVLGQSAFSKTKSLVSAELPRIATLTPQAFVNCSGLEWVSFDEITAVPDLRNTNVFNGCSSLTALYFPDALVDTAKTTGYWANYATLIKPLSEKPSA